VMGGQGHVTKLVNILALVNDITVKFCTSLGLLQRNATKFILGIAKNGMVIVT